jgi:hypothetical protein
MAGRSREMRRGVSTSYHLQSNDERARDNRIRHKRRDDIAIVVLP